MTINTKIPDIRSKFINIFMDWNSKINLSAIRNPEDIYQKHILDSLEILNITTILNSKNTDIFSISHKKIIDLGTWWWFPILPLAIYFNNQELSKSVPNNNIEFTGIDARRKKIDVINDIISKLKLTNCKAIWTRWEDLNWEFDILTARALGSIEKIMKYWYHLLKPWWKFILYKQFTDQENQEIQDYCDKHNLIIKKPHRYSLFKWDIQRIIYVIDKL